MVCSRITQTGDYVVIILSDEMIGVSTTQLTKLPTHQQVLDLIRTDVWVNAQKDTPTTVSIVYPTDEIPTLDLEISTQIALETALWLWKEWSPELKGILQPHPPVFMQGTHGI